ncbi:hypothetical protein C8R46DRAFT_658506 [Mycena filopes]|nr:hypothetical protein C8R46DRAFT_658506 [Mycena filopes]
MKSRFAHRFSTNYIPSDEEIEYIRQDLLLHGEELARLDELIPELSAKRDEIRAYVQSEDSRHVLLGQDLIPLDEEDELAGLNAAIPVLSARRAEIQVYVQAHRALISHARRLPLDVLREIFAACLLTVGDAVMSAKEAPLLLCHICSTWRALARATPTLWTSLHISDLSARRQSVVLQWLKLSAACPISVSIFPAQRYFGHATGINFRLRSLASTSARWRRVGFGGALTAEMMRELAQISAPVLESFKFIGTLARIRELRLLDAPNLRSVDLHSEDSEPQSFVSFVLGLPLVLDGLTHLSLTTGSSGGSPLHDIHILLGRCHRLVSFCFKADAFRPMANENDVWPDTAIDPIHLPFLETFIALGTSLSIRCIGRLIECVDMPQLRRFHVTTPNLSRADVLSLVALATKSPLLEDLHLCLFSFTPTPLQKTLRACSALTKLTVDATHISAGPPKPPRGCRFATVTDLLEILTSSPVVCPSLSELVLDNRDEMTMDEDVLHDFVRRRTSLAQGFRSLGIVLRGLRGYHVDPQIRTYGGVRISTSYLGYYPEN